MIGRGIEGFESLNLVNCVIANNTCGGGSGTFGSINMVHTTLAYNSGSNGMESAGNSSILNSIVYGNDGTQISSFNANVTYSLVQDFYPGAGNIASDPRFTDPDNGDFTVDGFFSYLGSRCTYRKSYL